MKILEPYKHKPTDKKIIVAIGMFDGVHIGHQHIIFKLNNLAEELGMESGIVTFTEHPQIVLGKNTSLKNIMPHDEKLKKLSNCGVENGVILEFTQELSLIKSKEFLRLLRDQYNVGAVLIGYNHKFGHDRKRSFEDYVYYGGKLGVEVIQADEYTGKHSPLSSSIIRQSIVESDVEGVALKMGSYFEIKGAVVHGEQNGRKIGFPTINIKPSYENQIIPKNGVYAVKVVKPGEFIKFGVCNVGTRPTIDKNNKQSIEVHIFNFDGDLYNQTLIIQFVKYIRDERKFDSLDSLKAQISLDCDTAKKILENTK